MQFVVPINDSSEVLPLARAGADEFYCGLLEDSWIAQYGNHDSISRRQGLGNFRTRAALREAVVRAAEVEIPVFLALNSRYTEAQLDYLTDLSLWFQNIGGAGLILRDIGLMERLSKMRNFKLPLTLSILAVAENQGSLEAFSSLGISRVVLPRFVDPQLASTLLKPFPHLEAEVMAFYDKCPWVDGYCRHYHGVAYLDHPDYALSNADAAIANNAEETAKKEGLPTIYTFDTSFRAHACAAMGIASDPDPCGACSLHFFEEAGVRFAKIGGRGRPLEDRLRVLKFLRLSENMNSDACRKVEYQKTFGHECTCYYDKNRQSRTAIEERSVEGLGASRHIIGSQTDYWVYRSELSIWLDELKHSSFKDDDQEPLPVTILMPPLSQEQFQEFPEFLNMILGLCPLRTHLCINDLGSLVAGVKKVRSIDNCPLIITVGSLLANIDEGRERQAFFDSSKNPSRIVMDAQGKPCLLKYRAPSRELAHHWKTPSLLEPSSRRALEVLIGSYPLAWEMSEA